MVSLASILERLLSECEHNSVQQPEVSGVCELLEEIYSVCSIAYTFYACTSILKFKKKSGCRFVGLLTNCDGNRE